MEQKCMSLGAMHEVQEQISTPPTQIHSASCASEKGIENILAHIMLSSLNRRGRKELSHTSSLICCTDQDGMTSVSGTTAADQHLTLPHMSTLPAEDQMTQKRLSLATELSLVSSLKK